jgi:hypothetical protein
MGSRMKSNVKLAAAVIGGSALVTMGAFAAATHQQVRPDALFAKTSMTVGATTTPTKAPTVEATSVAVPTIKGPAALPSEEEDAK